MVELRVLRDSIRAAEATLPVPEAIEPASFALSPPEKARLTSETFSALHLSTAD